MKKLTGNDYIVNERKVLKENLRKAHERYEACKDALIEFEKRL